MENKRSTHGGKKAFMSKEDFDDKYNKVINAGIKQVRKALNLTMDEFSEKTGLSKGVIYRVEKGTNVTRHATVKTIIETLDVSASFLYHGTLPMFSGHLTEKEEIEAKVRSIYGPELCDNLGDYHIDVLVKMNELMRHSHHMQFALLDFLIRFFKANGIDVPAPNILEDGND